MEEVNYEELEEDDEKKKRRKILLWLFIIGVIVAIIALILSIVMCRRDNNNVDVVYEDMGVDARVSAYSINQGGVLEKVGDDLWFDKERTNPNQSQTMPSIVLSSERGYVVFAYYFENLSDNEQMDVTLDISDMTVTNMTVSYLVDYGDSIIDITGTGYTRIDEASINNTRLNPQSESYGKSAYIYIKASIDDYHKNSEFSGQIHWRMEPATTE